VLLLVVCARINRPCIVLARLHCPHCCNTIAQVLGNIRPALDPPCVCHAPHLIGNDNIMLRPTRELSSCAWLLQDVLLLQSVCAQVHHPRSLPPAPTCNTHTISILLRAMNDSYTARPLYAILHTTLVTAMSWKGQFCAPTYRRRARQPRTLLGTRATSTLLRGSCARRVRAAQQQRCRWRRVIPEQR